MSDKNPNKILLPGGAGLVGQNLIVQLKQAGYDNITVIDKHLHNIAILQQLHPDIKTIEADLAEPGAWQQAFDNTDFVVMLQAQIGAKEEQPFIRNNIIATENILQTMKQLPKQPYLIHISSSVVNSVADDFYTNTKKRQEILVIESGLDYVVLRPTLMFGWFDRKHLGWLSRFMQKVPVFPIPGHGRYMRQPLYVKDFCNVIAACIEHRPIQKLFNISGREYVDYIDIIRAIKSAIKSRTLILNIPYGLFYILLKIWAVFDKNPPFTADQLTALVAKDEFEIIDWPGLFNVDATPFKNAIDETFNHPVYSQYELSF